MSNVVSLDRARDHKEQQSTPDACGDGSFHSPVPHLIGQLELILDNIRHNNGVPREVVRNNLYDYLDLLSSGRSEIDELEDMARFLLQLCSEDEPDL